MAVLYKYLDLNGGMAMLEKHNLQFTNATQLNDPFDCHPGLIDFSKVPEERTRVWSQKDIMELEADKFKKLRDKTWICSLSKTYDSLLMWSYYCKHKSVCIGIDMEKSRTYLNRVNGVNYCGVIELEVQYREVLDKPDYFRNDLDLFKYLLSTKAKDWQHEQEIRLLAIDPSPITTPMTLPQQPERNEVVDWKEVRAYPTLGPECFDSIYLGTSISKCDKESIVTIARDLNPEIKIYQMIVNPYAFKFEKQLI